MKARVILGAIALLVLFMGFVQSARAEELMSDQYVITDSFLELNPETPQRKNPDTYSLLRNNSERSQFADKGFIIRRINEPIGISVDNAHIQPKPVGNPNRLEQITELSITHAIGRRAALTIGQVDGLKSLSGSLIDATKCDQVKDPCTRSLAKEWNSDSAWGLGYTINGHFFKPFSKLYQREQEEMIVLKDRDQIIRSEKLGIRIRKSEDDRAETYQTIVQMTASLLY